MTPNPTTVYVDRAYTAAGEGRALYTPPAGNVMADNQITKWACEELNLGPHAYQAEREKTEARTSRSNAELDTACATPERAKHPPRKAQARRQRVYTKQHPAPLSLGQPTPR